MCPPVLRHICGPCRPGRGRAQTQPFGDPPMWQKQVKCDFLAQTHLLSGRERRWLFLCDLLTVMHVCMKPSCSALYVTMYHVVSHVRYSPDRGWRSVNYSSLLIFICSVCFVVDYTFYVRFVWKPVAATEKKVIATSHNSDFFLAIMNLHLAMQTFFSEMPAINSV